MLIPGIKLGPKDWLEKLEATKAKLVEVWYRVDKPEWYQAMFDYLHQQGITFGLHFWGVTSTGHEANLAYPGPNQLKSINLIKTCLDQAAAQTASYVNIHSGNRQLMFIHLDDLSQIIPDQGSPVISHPTATATRNTALSKLGAYANSKRVQLLVEAIPQKVATDSRLNPAGQFPANLTGLHELCKQGLIGFTNDFCHTFAHSPKNFTQITNRFAHYTRLIHVNTLTPPYNGTDEHRGILAEDLDQAGVFPNKSNLIGLLTLIQSKSKSDLFLIGEPQDDHVQNYFALQKIIQLVG